ncbi:hypothetical protein Kfla_4732 [Kribbella flavida DSM 17836]|uniref:Uncharacterized protein n=1 Tax=Kribbella flavida (strain DSM 17836 / JCM 10339 / NBRC 14399) TaxID=479435 RepID=D2PZE0_KRIFD|nr:DUF6461 domain-containing protein [Kribbella flavida]ADB33749.1 hypothetical protein Kfla_4732 [Kribbella flavida DSM 17836]
MTAADDYLWTQPDLQNCDCVTMVQDIAPDELLDRLGATERGGPVDFAGLCQLPPDGPIVVGFEVEDGEDDDYEIGPVQEASYALMEHLTGVRLTPELVTATIFTTGPVAG